jgi:hypothetical protein
MIYTWSEDGSDGGDLVSNLLLEKSNMLDLEELEEEEGTDTIWDQVELVVPWNSSFP